MKRHLGLTLVELVVTLAVMLIVITIGAPLYRSLQANNRAAAQTGALVAALNLARSEALTRGVPVAACARVNGAKTCNTGSYNWADGWLVFVDNNPKNGELDTGDEDLIRVSDALSGSPTVTFDSAYVRFAADGSAGTGGTVGLRIHQAGAKGTQDRCVQITAVGQVRASRIGSGDSCP